MKTAWYLVIALFGSLHSVARSTDVSSDERALMDEIVAVQRAREKLYGNMHAIWRETRIEEDGSQAENTVEFWSREHKYYRVDVSNASDVSGTKQITRTVVRPEKYARLHAFSRDSSGALFEVGGADELEQGMKWIRGDAWYCQANKLANEQTFKLITDWLSGKSPYESVSVVRQDDGSVLIKALTDEEDSSSSVEHVLSAVDYRFLNAKARIDRKNDKSWYQGVWNKVYDDEQLDIPIASSEVYTESDGRTESLSYKLAEFRLEPAPMEVFELPEFVESSNSNWMRRLVLLTGGATLLAIYFFLRWRKNKT